MGRSYTAALTDPDELARRRALESFLFFTRWSLLAILLALALIVRAAPLGLSLAALAVASLQNLLRIPLIAVGTVWRMRRLGLALFALDLAVVLVALGPMLRRGDHPVPVILLLLLLEAGHRLRMERRAVALPGITAVALVLIVYALALGRHDRTHWADIAFWLGGFLAVETAVVISRLPLIPVPRPAAAVVAEPGAAPPVPPPAAPPALPLTPQQREVLRLIAAGEGTRAIADRLHLSPETVRSHLHHIFRHLDVHSRAEAVARARELGYLD